MKRLALLVWAGLSLGGCYHMKFTTNGMHGQPTSEPKWHHNFVYFAEYKQVDLGAECPNGFVEVNHQLGVLQALVPVGAWVVSSGITAITFGVLAPVGSAVSLTPLIWQPTEYTVACSEGPAVPMLPGAVPASPAVTPSMPAAATPAPPPAAAPTAPPPPPPTH